MRKINSHGSNTVMAGMFLLAVLTSANVLAETPAAPMDNAGQAASLATAGSEVAFKRQPSSTGTQAKSRPATSARVYLDDYTRIPHRVTRQYPTKPYWVGAKKGQGKSPE